MNVKTSTVLLLPIIAFLLSGIAHAQPAAASASTTARPALERAKAALERNGPAFIENRGQWPAAVRYAARTNGLDMWVTDAGITYDLYTLHESAGAPARATTAADRPSMPPTGRKGHLVRMEFVGAAAGTTRGVERVPGYYNFFIGNDPSRWASNVGQFRETRIDGLYKGIGARLYFDEGMPRYDIVVEPHADPSSIRVRYAGAERASVNGRGELVIGTSMGDIEQHGLYAYQMIEGRQRRVSCSFTLAKDGTVGFAMGSYDRSAAVVIDPLVYSTFIGGSGDDNAYAMEIDGSGYAYLTGYASAWTAAADSFPTRVGAYDISYNGGTIDAFVTKLDCATNTLAYSTFIGGSSFEDARAIVLDGAQNAYVCGYTGSSDFPTTASAYARNYNGGPFDGFVLKLSSTGSALGYSTFIGGQYTDGCYALGLTSGGAARVCGYTASADFPTTAGAYDRTFNGNDDIFSLTLSADGGSLSSSTYIGGTGTDYAYAILVDGTGNAYISGNTSSTDFPTTGGAYSRTYAGGAHDACVMRVSAGDNGLMFSTFLGGGGDDFAYGIDIGASGELTVTGYTSSNNFPTTPGAYDATYNGGAFDIFVTKFDQSPSTLRYSTFIGGSSDDYAYDVVLDASENAFICGNTASDSIPTTPGAYDRTHNDISYDGYIAELNTSGTTVLYSTFIGGGEADIANDIDLLNNMVYICGTTHSRNYPVSANAYDDTLGKKYVDGQNVYSYDAFVSKLDLRNISLHTPANGLICPGTTQTISWESFGVSNVAIDVSPDGGTFWTPLVASAPAVGSYSWTVPNGLPPGSNYLIRVRDVSNPTIVDISDITLTVPPTLAIATQPASVGLCSSTAASLTVSATGLGLHYQWARNGVAVAGGTGPNLTFNPATTSDTGAYTVSVTDTCGSAVTSQTAHISMAPALQRLGDIGNVNVCVGDTLRWTARASGFGRLRYQWRRAGVDIAGATDSTFVLPITNKNQAGTYVAYVTDECPGRSATVTAELSVNDMEIVSQPLTQRVKPGESATFTVGVAASGVSFQWRLNGVNIPGATNPSYTVASASAADTGTYDVVITGPCTRISNGARLTVEGVGAVPGTPDAFEGMMLTVAPNPASGRTVITLTPPMPAARAAGAGLALYNVAGQLALDLTPSFVAGGYRSAEFDAASVPAGVYYCRLVKEGVVGMGELVIVAR